MHNYTVILKNRPYLLLWLGALVSRFGDSFTEFGLAWYVLGRSQNPLDVGLTFLIFRLPALFSGILAGWWLDHFRRELVMLADNLMRGALVLLIPLLSAAGSLSLPVLYLLIAGLGALSVVTTVGSRALITEMVEPRDYAVANTLDTSQGQISSILGPGIAGLLVAVVGPLALLWIDSFSFFFFAAILVLLLIRPHTSAQDTTTKLAPPNFWKQLAGGISFTCQSPLLLAMLSISFGWNFGLGLFNVTLPFYCNGPLGVGPAGMGALLAVNSLGVLISILLFGPLQPRYPGRVTCWLLIGQAICYAIIGTVPLFWLILPVYFVLGCLDDLGAIYLATVRQKVIPMQLQGRVLAFYSTVGNSGTPLGSGFAGILLTALGSQKMILVAGLPLLALGLVWLLIGPLRQLKE